MANEVDYDRMVSTLKKNPDWGQAKIAEDQGILASNIPMTWFCAAQVDAGIWDSIPETARAAKLARDNDQNRWELIAARMGEGVSVAHAKALYEEAGGNADARVTRGNGSTAASGSSKSKTATSRSKSKTAGSAGKKSAASKKTSSASKKSASASKTRAARAGIVRNRQGRSGSKTGNPS